MENDKYFSHAWKLLTRDKGWVKPLLVMTAASLVPIAGPLGNKGYGLEWARLTAWGVDAAPKQKNVDVGKLIVSGWRGFIVDLVWGLMLCLAIWLLYLIAWLMPSVFTVLFSFLASIVTTVASACWGVIMLIAELRASIYERIGAGLRIDRVFQMIRRDVRGFGKVFLINLVCAVILSVIGSIFCFVLFMQCMPVLVAATYDPSTESIIYAVSAVLVWIVLSSILFVLVVIFVSLAARLLTLTATGLWMRQFDVPSWGRSQDPLPDTASVAKGHTPPAPGDENVDAQQGVPQEPHTTAMLPEVLAQEPEQSPLEHGDVAVEDMPTTPLVVAQDEPAAAEGEATQESSADVAFPAIPADEGQEAATVVEVYEQSVEDMPALSLTPVAGSVEDSDDDASLPAEDEEATEEKE